VNVHNNARLTPMGRACLVHRVVVLGWSIRATAKAAGVDPRTVRRWLQRFEERGHEGLKDRSSRPHHSPRRTAAAVEKRIVELRHRRWSMERIAEAVLVSRATVCRVLTRQGLNRLSALEPKEPPRRYQHEHPGDLLHLDIKKLGRFRVAGHRVTNVRTKQSEGMGWEFVHVAIDDRSRISFTEIHSDERWSSAVAHLRHAVEYYAKLGVTIRRLLTDNGSCYRSKEFAKACEELGLKHSFTRPYTPRTNGKAERFIQTALREWAYAHRYESSAERAAHLPRWTHEYNWHRRHGSLQGKPPINVLELPEDNLMRLHT
jgi:transposase InsO family protein